MIYVFLLTFYRYTKIVTQYGKYHLFPPFSFSGSNSVACETDISEISSHSDKINSTSSNGFGILLNFRSYPSVFNVESQISDLTTLNFYSNSTLKYNYTDFTQTPSYPVVINSANKTYKYKITVTCSHGSSGMDLRDKFRIYYLPCYFVLFIPMLVAAYRISKRKNVRIMCLVVFFIYFLSFFFRYISILISIQSYDVNKNYINTYDFIITADVFSSIMRIFSWSILLANCYHPVFIDNDFSIKNISIIILLLNIFFELIDGLLFVDVFPFLEEETISKKYFSWLSTSFKNIQILYWSMYSVFPIELIIIIVKILNFLPRTKSKFIRRTVKGTMWLIIIVSYSLYISGKLGVYFAMINGGFSTLTNLIVDTTDFFFPSLVMGAVYHFEKSRQYYAEKLRKRREKKNQTNRNNKNNPNQKKKNLLVDSQPLNEPNTNYTQMNQPLLLNSTNSVESNYDLA